MRIAERSLIETRDLRAAPERDLEGVAERRREKAVRARSRVAVREQARAAVFDALDVLRGRRVDPGVADDPVDGRRCARRERRVARPGLGARVDVTATGVRDALPLEATEPVFAQVRPR
jgi:hypothetical protein